ncbi:hypothetical protein GCM10010981_30980 [Dyella nitratireducens]|uniref:Uncharacterized protein n=1 Tax=Dyella nitratireducens TaxID=1849580 RepID=A0ABQ1G9V7_9GAMM|nr:hypothetical protein GCM10010981_30980 [Dyella nitratireducens]GLQ40455.1 hypothetical protein GCM10007902_03040 [Dyella nitratireducens]
MIEQGTENPFYTACQTLLRQLVFHRVDVNGMRVNIRGSTCTSMRPSRVPGRPKRYHVARSGVLRFDQEVGGRGVHGLSHASGVPAGALEKPPAIHQIART